MKTNWPEQNELGENVWIIALSGIWKSTTTAHIFPWDLSTLKGEYLEKQAMNTRKTCLQGLTIGISYASLVAAFCVLKLLRQFKKKYPRSYFKWLLESPNA